MEDEPLSVYATMYTQRWRDFEEQFTKEDTPLWRSCLTWLWGVFCVLIGFLFILSLLFILLLLAHDYNENETKYQQQRTEWHQTATAQAIATQRAIIVEAIETAEGK